MKRSLLPKQGYWLVGLWLLAGLLVSACSGASPTPVSTPTVAPETVAKQPSDELKGMQPGDSEEDAPTEALAPTDTAVVEEASAPEPTTSPTEEPATGRTFTPSSKVSLEASNPANFNIASGELQLVEFFAFW